MINDFISLELLATFAGLVAAVRLHAFIFAS